MSRHSALDAIDCCAAPTSQVVDWTQLVDKGARATPPTPIDEFYNSQRSLVLLAALVGDTSIGADASELLAGQLLLGYVSATELYLRRTIARMVRVCPQLRAANSSQVIQFGAVDYYGRSEVEYALTEQVSFTEPGKVRGQLSKILNVPVVSGTSLERSIAEFERLCQLRHALVHSHGVLSSANASLLLGTAGNKTYRTRLNPDSLEWAAVVAVNLVRDVNREIIRSTLWNWLSSGYLTTVRRVNRPRVHRLVSAIASKADLDSKLVAYDTDDLTDIITAVASDINGRKRSR